ncbi:unnamed protein product [Calicophoron daubneyi]|uniref:ZSWIM3 N-terminal domain-containing protein n=1 Tax=Calicophoron daubneyi TaxID=300641 RepID=A0AAV2TM98_CALDB
MDSGSPIVDLRAEFDKIVGKSKWSNFGCLEAALVEFQRQTGTSYYVETSHTVEAYEKSTGEALPKELKYQRIRFACVHSAGHRPERKVRRYTNYNCKSVMAFVEDGGSLRLSVVNMRHSHPVHSDQPWVYARNRQLSKKQQALVEQLIACSTSVRQIMQYVDDRFSIKLKTHDVKFLRRRWQLKQRGKSNSSDHQFESPSEMPQLPFSEDEPTDGTSPTKEEPNNEASALLEKSLLVDALGKELTRAMFGLADDAFQEQLENMHNLVKVLERYPKVRGLYSVDDGAKFCELEELLGKAPRSQPVKIPDVLKPSSDSLEDSKQPVKIIQISSNIGNSKTVVTKKSSDLTDNFFNSPRIRIDPEAPPKSVKIIRVCSAPEEPEEIIAKSPFGSPEKTVSTHKPAASRRVRGKMAGKPIQPSSDIICKPVPRITAPSPQSAPPVNSFNEHRRLPIVVLPTEESDNVYYVTDSISKDSNLSPPSVKKCRIVDEPLTVVQDASLWYNSS